MKLRFSIRDVLWLTLLVALLAAICRVVPVIEWRDAGLPLRSLYPREPSLGEFAIRLALSIPLVLGFLYVRRILKCAALG